MDGWAYDGINDGYVPVLEIIRAMRARGKIFDFGEIVGVFFMNQLSDLPLQAAIIRLFDHRGPKNTKKRMSMKNITINQHTKF